MRRVLCIHMPHLAIDRARRSGGLPPDSEYVPTVLTRRVGSSVVVEQVCTRAQAHGLRPGVTLGQAHALAADLAVGPHDPLKDRALLERLAGWAVRFSPLVQPLEPDTLLLDVTGCERLFGGERNIVQQAVGGLARHGIRARAAIADTIGAAYAVATAGGEVFLVVPPGQQCAALAPLPPAALRIDPRVCVRLDQLGVRTIGDVLMLPRADLPARFGADTVLRLQQALGEAFEPLVPQPSKRTAVARRAFEEPVRELPVVQHVARELLARVFADVLQLERAVRRLVCVLYCDHAPAVVISIGLARGSRSSQHVEKLLEGRLERVDLTPGVCGLMLLARETSIWRGGQGNLFEPRAPGEQEALATLLDRLTDRLGTEAVVRPVLLDDYQPEMAYRYESIAEMGCDVASDEGVAKRKRGKPDGSSVSACEAAQAVVGGAGFRQVEITSKPMHLPQVSRPLCLLARPMPIRVIALVPDGPPTWMLYENRPHVIVRAWGPERIETAWWRGADVRRDYFRLLAESGEQFWVFRTLRDHAWFLHGVFA